MHAPHFSESTVHDITEKHPEATHVLRTYHVDVTASQNLPMAEVAQAVTAQTDEMLAVMEYQMRRAARKAAE